jgi:outer membrane immunogenic protein
MFTLNRHREFCLASVLALALTGGATAADLAPIAPVVAPVVPWSWTGFYLGTSGGYGWSRSQVDPVGANVFCDPFFASCSNVAGNALVGAIPTAVPIHASGGILGAQVGYNVQFGSFLAGVETDLSWTGMKGSNTQTGFAPVDCNGAAPKGMRCGFPDSISSVATADQRLQSFGTLRGRLGWVPVNPLLVYATGGLAYGQLKSGTALSEVVNGGCEDRGGCSISPGLGAVSSTRTGWTIGAGLEWMFLRNWTLKAEYLYFDLVGSTSYGLTPIAVFNPDGPLATTAVTSNSTDFKGSIFRVGLNYLFN